MVAEATRRSRRESNHTLLSSNYTIENDQCESTITDDRDQEIISELDIV